MSSSKTGIKHLENNRINWFPGHMNKAIQEIKKDIKLVDIVVEVRDARAPMASGNKKNYTSAGDRPYLIVINKTNLADPNTVKLWEAWFKKEEESFIFVNALDKKSIKTITKKCKEVLSSYRLKLGGDSLKNQSMTMMILGLPNTGKSTIINRLSNRNATKAASTPGQTKTKQWVKVDGGLSILDTPGVMPPRIAEQIHGMWLSAIHAIPDYIITPDTSAYFIIEYLLKSRSNAFRDHYKLENLETTAVDAIEHIGKKRGCLRSGGVFDYEHIYKIILADFRKGLLGKVSFERPPEK